MSHSAPSWGQQSEFVSLMAEEIINPAQYKHYHNILDMLLTTASRRNYAYHTGYDQTVCSLTLAIKLVLEKK